MMTFNPKIPLVILYLAPVVFIVSLMSIFTPQLMANLKTYDLGHYWFYIFHFPHVLMGFMTLIDKEYIDTYKTYFTKTKVALYVLAYSTIIYYPEIYFIIFSFLLGRHFSKQQCGIESLLCKTSKVYSSKTMHLGTLIFGITYYIMVFSGLFSKSSFLKEFFISMSFWERFSPYFISFMIGLLLLDVLERYKYSETKVGRYYIWGNFFLHASVLGAFYLNDYWICAAIPRVVHDLTSLYLYFLHDRNRNREKVKNIFMRIFRIPIYLWVGVPFLLSLLQGKCFGQIEDFLPNLVFMSLAIFHFYYEGFIWKHDSPHMRNLFGR
jgi:hypothetical protein